MKTQLKALLIMKVHQMFFVLVCALLAGVMLDAKIQADDASAASDNVLRMPGLARNQPVGLSADPGTAALR